MNDNHHHSTRPKKPEFIIIDEISDSSDEYKTTYEDLTKIQDIKYPFIVRLVFVLAVLCAFGWIVGTFFSMILFSLASALTLFQIKKLNAFLALSYRFFKISLIVFLGALIGIFSPPLGLGLIILFFTIQADSSGSFLHRLLKNFMNRF